MDQDETQIRPAFEATGEPPDCAACGGPVKSATISFGQALVPEVIERAIWPEELEGFQSPGHADHIKVFLSADGRPLPRPERHPDGLAWPDDVPKPFMRDYTPRYFDPVSRRPCVSSVSTRACINPCVADQPVCAADRWCPLPSCAICASATPARSTAP